jgi:hypothetical protein
VHGLVELLALDAVLAERLLQAHRLLHDRLHLGDLGAQLLVAVRQCLEALLRLGRQALGHLREVFAFGLGLGVALLHRGLGFRGRLAGEAAALVAQLLHRLAGRCRLLLFRLGRRRRLLAEHGLQHVLRAGGGLGASGRGRTLRAGAGRLRRRGGAGAGGRRLYEPAAAAVSGSGD